MARSRRSPLGVVFWVNDWGRDPDAQRLVTMNILFAAYFSLSHKQRASMRAYMAPGIMVYAAEFLFSAA